MIALVPLGVTAALIQASIYDVPGGYRAVMFDRFQGVKKTVLISGCEFHNGGLISPKASGEGTHFLIPGLQRAILSDVRIKPRVSCLSTPPSPRLKCIYRISPQLLVQRT